MTTSGPERDYVLGTHDEEIERLGLQHRVWRPRVLDAWRRAGFGPGQTILDVGAGPGYATLDLAEIVGPSGRVVALERSRRFLDALELARRRRGFDQIEAREMDLDEGDLPALQADGAWCRWVLAFVKQPRELLARLSRALRPGATLVIHEYFDYSTWRLAPPTPEAEEFVRLVMESWRAGGGEPDVGLELPRWLEESGFALRALRPYVDVVAPSDDIWQWPKAFLGSRAAPSCRPGPSGRDASPCHRRGLRFQGEGAEHLHDHTGGARGRRGPRRVRGERASLNAPGVSS